MKEMCNEYAAAHKCRRHFTETRAMTPHSERVLLILRPLVLLWRLDRADIRDAGEQTINRTSLIPSPESVGFYQGRSRESICVCPGHFSLYSLMLAVVCVGVNAF
jgi:hypothetical protein